MTDNERKFLDLLILLPILGNIYIFIFSEIGIATILSMNIITLIPIIIYANILAKRKSDTGSEPE